MGHPVFLDNDDAPISRRPPDPDVALPSDLELDPFADVAARLLGRVRPVDIRQRAQAEPPTARTYGKTSMSSYPMSTRCTQPFA